MLLINLEKCSLSHHCVLTTKVNVSDHCSLYYNTQWVSENSETIKSSNMKL